MTKEEIITKHCIGVTCGQVEFDYDKAEEALEEYAKYHAGLAFDAGYKLAAKHETNHPNDALDKEDYLKKYFHM